MVRCGDWSGEEVVGVVGDGGGGGSSGRMLISGPLEDIWM